jgi:hypothetical protein
MLQHLSRVHQEQSDLAGAIQFLERTLAIRQAPWAPSTRTEDNCVGPRGPASYTELPKALHGLLEHSIS